MTNAYKLYLASGKFRVIDEQDFISIAKDRMLHNNILKKRYQHKELTKLIALKIYKAVNASVQGVNAILLNVPDKVDPVLKTIDILENDIAAFMHENKNEEYHNIYPYLKGSKDAMIKILEENLKYDVAEDEKRTLEGFIDKEVYFTSEFSYKHNKITIELSHEKFITDEKTKKIYKYKSTILDADGYRFNFRKNELFATREEAINESKKLINEHYKLPIRNSKIKKIIVRTDAKNTIIVFWPNEKTDDGYIISNDIIGDHDLAGDTKTSITFFEKCQNATEKEVLLAKKVIQKCLIQPTYNVKHL